MEDNHIKSNDWTQKFRPIPRTLLKYVNIPFFINPEVSPTKVSSPDMVHLQQRWVSRSYEHTGLESCFSDPFPQNLTLWSPLCSNQTTYSGDKKNVIHFFYDNYTRCRPKGRKYVNAFFYTEF